MFDRRSVLSLGIGWVATASIGRLHAQSGFPDRPIKIIMPYAAGGFSDVLIRVIDEVLRERIKQPIVIENRTGANGLVAYQAGADAAPDGYTMTFVGASLSSTLAVSRRPYDLDKHYRIVSGIWQTVNLLVVNAESKIRTVGDLIVQAKATPGVPYTSVGIGSGGHRLS